MIDGRELLMARRDALLREAEALRNKVEGLTIAINIVADEAGFGPLEQTGKGKTFVTTGEVSE